MPKNLRLRQDQIERVLFPALHRLFLDPYRNLSELARAIRDETGVPVNQWHFNALIREGIQRGTLRLTPTVDQELGGAIVRRFPNQIPTTVVDVEMERPGETPGAPLAARSIAGALAGRRGRDPSLVSEAVADVAADYVFNRIVEISEERVKKWKSTRRAKPGGRALPSGTADEADRNDKTEVRLGVAAGRSAHRLAQRLGTRLAAYVNSNAQRRSDLKLAIHALAPAGTIAQPLESPIASFGYFHQALGANARFIGMFVEPIVQADRYREMLQRPSIMEARREAKRLDIVVTGLAAAKDDHGYLRRCLSEAKEPVDRRADLRGWIGDVHLRPFTPDRPIRMDRGMWPVTLLELSDFKDLARSKERCDVILVGSPCGVCGESKADALRRILTVADLRVCNRLILDRGTAREILSSEALQL